MNQEYVEQIKCITGNERGLGYIFMYLFYILDTVLEDDQALTRRSPEQPVVGAPALSQGLGWVISSFNCSVVLFSSFIYTYTHTDVHKCMYLCKTLCKTYFHI